MTREQRRVAIRGERDVIAHVGAWLVGPGRADPADLRVEMPDLEAALLACSTTPSTRRGSHIMTSASDATRGPQAARRSGQLRDPPAAHAPSCGCSLVTR